MAKKIAEEIGELLGCEYQLYLADDNAIEKDYFSAYKRGLDEGFTPLIIASSEGMLDLLLTYRDASQHYASNLVNEAKSIDLAAYFQKSSTLLENFDDAIAEDSSALFEDIPDGYHFNTLDPDFADLFLLVHLPTRNAWELPAYIPMGGFNDCPIPEAQVAIFKAWNNRYGMIPAIVHEDIWECWLQSPVIDRNDAKKLACEHYIFCSDIVDQGVESIEFLSEILQRSKNWYFWWD